MTYFPLPRELRFQCPGCKKWFMPGNYSCCVLHAPGTCCHYSDTEIPAPQETREEMHDLL